MKYPKEAPVFEYLGEHWTARPEFLGLNNHGAPEYGFDAFMLSSDYERHLVRTSLLRPLTPAAREMLAIAKGRK